MRKMTYPGRCPNGHETNANLGGDVGCMVPECGYTLTGNPLRLPEEDWLVLHEPALD